jgi:di/tricarboxylate transporter
LNLQIALLLILILATIANFLFEILSVEIFALSLMGSLILLQILSPEQAFLGFSNPAVIMIAGAMVMTGSIIHNGAADFIARRLHRLAGHSQNRLLVILLGTVTFMSAFINNVAATAMFIPVTEGISKRKGQNPRRYLMPIAFTSMLGGVCTLIGTSTNVAVSGALGAYGIDPIGMFELTPIGVVIAVVGVGYLFLVARFFISAAPTEDRVDDYGMREYLFEIEVEEGSPIAGLTVATSGLAEKYQLSILAVVRGAERILSPSGSVPILAGDLLLVEGGIHTAVGGVLPAGLKVKTDPRFSDRDLQSDRVKVVEATVSYNSPFVGSSLKKLNLRRRFDLNVLAIFRRGEPVVEKVGHIPIQAGDLLLIQGQEDRIRNLWQEPAYLLLEDVTLPEYNPRRSLRALIIFGTAILLGTSGILSIPAAFLIGAVLTMILRCFTFEEAEHYLNLRLILIVAAMLSMSVAMEVSGTAEFLAASTVEALHDAGPLALMAGFFLLTVLLTQPMSNSAAALLVLPIGIHAAELISVDPRPFVIAILLAASCAFLTPLEPACLLVFSTGKYRYTDYLRYGFGLTVLVFLIALFLVPRLWPFQPAG